MLNLEYLSARSRIELTEHLFNVYGAVRLLLLPMLGKNINCYDLNLLVNGVTVNYKVEGFLQVVGPGVGSLKEGRVPCALNLRRMPPLQTYIELGYLKSDYSVGPRYREVVENYRHILEVAYAASLGGLLTEIKRRVYRPKQVVVEALSFLRTLYPSLLEIYRGDKSFGDFLRSQNSLIRRDDYWTELFYFVETGVVLPRDQTLIPPLHIVRRVRSPSAKYAIPPLLDYVDFRDALVIDIGSGFGTKGAYSIRRGARFVLLLDIDESILRERGSGALVDRVVGDAQFLPFRDGAADVAIFWNVLPFLYDEDKALEEVARVARRYVVFSVYNASSGRRYTWGEFLERAGRLGSLVRWRRLGNVQFQAVVRREDRRAS